MTPQEEIKAWLDSGRDYSAGIALFKRFGKNKVLISLLSKPGKELMQQNHRKLEYELKKIAGSELINLRSDIVNQPETIATKAPPDQLPQIKTEKKQSFISILKQWIKTLLKS